MVTGGNYKLNNIITTVNNIIVKKYKFALCSKVRRDFHNPEWSEHFLQPRYIGGVLSFASANQATGPPPSKQQSVLELKLRRI